MEKSNNYRHTKIRQVYDLCNMKKNNLQSFIRADLKDWECYSPGDSAWELATRFGVDVEGVIKLNANENPYGPSPAARKAIESQRWYNYYPGGNYTDLRKALASYIGAAKEQIVIGTGLDEVIDLLLRLTIEPGDEIINCPPTFSMYPLYAKLNRAKIVSIPRKKDYALDMPAMKNAINKKTKVIFVCNPNNPTGKLTPLSDIETLLKTGKLVIVDEAYAEFANQTSFLLLKKYDNLIVLRTFSKWAGLAGLRIGFAVLDPFLAEKFNAIKSPFNVNLAAETAAIATLSDMSFAKQSIKKLISERDRMYKALQKLNGLITYPSKGNFLFFELKNKKYAQLKDVFEQNKCAIRFYDSSLSGQGVRVTVGKPEQNSIVLKVLKEFFV